MLRTQEYLLQIFHLYREPDGKISSQEGRSSIESLEVQLTNRIRDRVSSLGPSRRSVVEYIAANLEVVAFWPAAKLAEAAGVSESAVVRAARDLGFSGYPQLQDSLQRVVKERLFRMAQLQVGEEGNRPPETGYERVHLGALANVETTYRSNSPGAVSHAASLILAARRVGVIGSRVAYPVAQYLGFYIHKLLGNGGAWEIGADTLVDHVRNTGEGDVVIAIAFRSYGRRTVRAAELTKRRGATLIAITDSAASPLAVFADVVLLTETWNGAIIRSLAGPMTIAEQLLTAVVQGAPERIKTTLADLEAVAYELNT